MQTLGTDPRISCTGCPGHTLRQQYALSGRGWCYALSGECALCGARGRAPTRRRAAKQRRPSRLLVQSAVQTLLFCEKLTRPPFLH